jgi:ferredoxin-NADP reductase/nitrite reductase/ring-hydroxylating ferredoxin subunit
MITEQGYQKVASKKDLKEGGLFKVEPNGKPIVLAMVNGKVYAMDAVCSHEGGPLEEGTLEGHELTCPWHNAIFDVRNAKVSEQTVWATDLNSYPVTVDETTGDVLVSLQTKQEASSLPATEEKVGKKSEFLLTLKRKEKLEGTDITTFRFVRDDFPDYKPGQFAYFPLDNVNNDPKGRVRHFSLASSPTEDEVIISTRIRDTPYKQRLASLEPGSQVAASKPHGNFVLHDEYSKPAVFLSGGIGVTPFRNMIKYATDKQLSLRITMFDSNRDEQNILYRKEFDRWASQNRNLKVIYTVTEEGGSTTGTWQGEKGRIGRAMLERHLGKDDIANSIFYICGPPAMLKAVQGLLRELQIPEERVKIEEFTGY